MPFNILQNDYGVWKGAQNKILHIQKKFNTVKRKTTRRHVHSICASRQHYLPLNLPKMSMCFQFLRKIKRNATHYKTGLRALGVSGNEVRYLVYLGTCLTNQSSSQFLKIAQC